MHYFNNPLHFYSSFHHKDQRSASTNNKCRDHAPSCLKLSQEDNNHIYTHSATSSVIKELKSKSQEKSLSFMSVSTGV